MSKLYFGILLLICSTIYAKSSLTINDSDYFTMNGLSVLVFHNTYPEGHQGGIEIIQHDERIATNGDVRLEATPGQWDPLPQFNQRIVDKKLQQMTVSASYADLDINYHIYVKSEGEAIRITVDLDEALPFQWVGKIGFNLEFFPEYYFDKTFFMDKSFGLLPHQANGPVKLSSSNKTTPLPIASGRSITLAPEDPTYHITVKSNKGKLALYDGRITDNNGWFVLRSLIPAGAKKSAVDWLVIPHIQNDWEKSPVILHSQVGYFPSQEKKAVIEVIPSQKRAKPASLKQLTPEGIYITVFSDLPKKWGAFLRYDYTIFDFSSITKEGIFIIECDGIETKPFKISSSLLEFDIWQPTLETFFPVQMCHMEVRDRYRIWHGLCHMDDALQAPLLHEHFDGYNQGEKSETSYKPYQHITGLNSGGWHDAGDYDLATGSQATTTYYLSLIYELFSVHTDQTTVDQNLQLVELHKPDGKNDLLQQIEHGVLYLLAGYRTSGHSYCGIISSTIEQYVHLGDASTMTDNVIYNASEDILPIPEHQRGKMDDRWVFTNRDTGLEYLVASTLAAASRVLHDYNPGLGDECLSTAEKIWNYEQANKSTRHRSAYIPGNMDEQKILAAIELYKTTKSQKYRKAIIDLQPEIQDNIDDIAWAVAQIFGELNDDTFDHEFYKVLRIYKANLEKELEQNPFSVPYSSGTWGIGWNLQAFAVEQFFLHKAFPELFSRDNVLNVVNFIHGCHPGSNTSFVSGVGAQSLLVAYGANRDDWSYIPGGVASGTALIKPDFPELKEPWPFLWQQTEYVMPGAASYIFCILAANNLCHE